ncbi:MAG: single-stranded DNA-binding protein [Candidatus Pacebacteria bacterium]|nr:single-stranded DNA-binding protein [Candidatus Paceibacterota bacterium]
MNLNKVFILGRLTADPMPRTTPTGMQVVNFSMATNRIWTDKSGARKDATEFHNIVVWGKQAETITKYLKKGSLLLVEGRLQTRTWDDKTGQKRKTTEIVAERIQLGPRPIGAGNQQFQPAAEEKPEAIPTIEIDEEIKGEDLPF